MIIVETMSKRNPLYVLICLSTISLNNFFFVTSGFLGDSDSKMTAKMIGQKWFLICASAEWGHLVAFIRWGSFNGTCGDSSLSKM